MLNDVDSIKHGDDEVVVLVVRRDGKVADFDIKALAFDEGHGALWYLEAASQ